MRLAILAVILLVALVALGVEHRHVCLDSIMPGNRDVSTWASTTVRDMLDKISQKQSLLDLVSRYYWLLIIPFGCWARRFFV